MKWTTEKHNFLLELVDKHNRKWKIIAEEMTKQFNEIFSSEQCRSRWRNNRHKLDEINPKDKYGVKTTKNADGTIETDRLIAISKEQLKDDKYILKAHGYDNSWEIVSHQFSMWNHFNRELTSPKTLYASKIRVKPKEDGFQWDELLEVVQKVPKAKIRPKHNIAKGNEYLVLPLYDMHFGISDYEYYMPTQSKILQLLTNNYKEILLIIGQDLFHNDDFRGRTSSGREIEKVDMVKAWNDAVLFFEPIIDEAISRKSKVSIYYSKGNHSETVEWTFVQRLKARYPNCYYDDSLKERKVHMLGNNFVGMNHGDKKNEKKLPENFATEFPKEWSKATTRTAYTGHRHVELVIDMGGIVIHRMPTRNIVDGWHDDMGYTTGHKRFKIIEYNENEIEIEYHV